MFESDSGLTTSVGEVLDAMLVTYRTMYVVVSGNHP